MPLFMDFHKFESVTIEAVKTAHIADKGIQEEYGVKYHQFWVNEDEGTVFCLVEGPDKKTCELVHQMAHGNVACALTEVETGLYEKMMGKNIVVDHGHVQHTNGTPDQGYRTIMVVTVYGITNARHSSDLPLFLTPHWARKCIKEKIAACRGREIKWEADDSIIGIFDDASEAVSGALQMQHELIHFEEKKPDIIFKIGISASQPVTAKGDFFNDAMKLAYRLSMTAKNNHVFISSLVKNLCKNEQLLADAQFLKSLKIKDEEFITSLIQVAEARLSDQHLDLNHVSREICVSRPQLYRKITALTGRTPNDFMRDLRMDKALSLLKQNKANISEIAYETGFSSPSYFTKCFTEKYGCNPSFFTKTI